MIKGFLSFGKKINHIFVQKPLPYFYNYNTLNQLNVIWNDHWHLQTINRNLSRRVGKEPDTKAAEVTLNRWGRELTKNDKDIQLVWIILHKLFHHLNILYLFNIPLRFSKRKRTAIFTSNVNKTSTLWFQTHLLRPFDRARKIWTF